MAPGRVWEANAATRAEIGRHRMTMGRTLRHGTGFGAVVGTHVKTPGHEGLRGFLWRTVPSPNGARGDDSSRAGTERTARLSGGHRRNADDFRHADNHLGDVTTLDECLHLG